FTRRRRPAGLIAIEHGAAEDRHHDEPAIRELVIADNSVAIGARFADTAESSEQRVAADRTVQRLARRVVARALLREDRQLRVDDLHDVVWTDGERVVGRVAWRGRIVGARPRDEPEAETVEA